MKDTDLFWCLFFIIFPFKKAVPSTNPPSSFCLPERFPLSHHIYFTLHCLVCITHALLRSIRLHLDKNLKLNKTHTILPKYL